jgi:nucleoside-diphosphate kinase
MERTLAILKPDCVRRGLVGKVLARIEAEGFKIRALKLIRLTDEEARRFYAVHQGKGFFESLIAFMTSGPCLPAILERDDAVEHWRAVLVELRGELGADLTENLVHGSDAADTSAFECAYLFSGTEAV